MDPGELREEVVIQAEVETADGQGGVSTSWQDQSHGEWWVRIQPAPSPERLVAFRTDGPVSHVVTGRYRNDITRESGLRWGSRFLKVVGTPVNLDRRREHLTVACLEGAHG